MYNRVVLRFSDQLRKAGKEQDVTPAMVGRSLKLGQRQPQLDDVYDGLT